MPEVVEQQLLNVFARDSNNYCHAGMKPTGAFIITSYGPDILVSAASNMVLETLLELLPEEDIGRVLAIKVEDGAGNTVALLDPFTMVLDLRYPDSFFRLVILSLAREKSHLQIH